MGFACYVFPSRLKSEEINQPIKQMKLSHLIPVTFSLLLVCGSFSPLRADDAAAAPVAPATATADDAAQKHIDKKTAGLLKALKLDDAAKAAQVKIILDGWVTTIVAWHKDNDAKLKELWSQWSKARSVVPKDEFPGEIIAHKIFDTYATLQPAYQTFTNKLAAELTPEQVDVVKEAWSRSPGMMRTYNAYLESAPGLNDDQKKVIYNRMFQAREDALLIDSDKEIINMFKVHKVKVEQYIGSLEWEKLHKAFANKGKAAASDAK